MTLWERALGDQISQEEWQIIWSQAAKSSLCSLFKENAYNILFLVPNPRCTPLHLPLKLR